MPYVPRVCTKSTSARVLFSPLSPVEERVRAVPGVALKPLLSTVDLSTVKLLTVDCGPWTVDRVECRVRRSHAGLGAPVQSGLAAGR